ncbi:hypothetical protein [Rhodopseudomonas palustris]|uniref:hypothetical protein n=1 Tax=Rhodopseudomonas palustris TaxID=1076 RepID=UPI0021F3304D|nr:hypothetical protein [Rhodopseudomonas palustris]UYO52270.1 hypothetical protein KQX61_16860 [Rhodopseudomonas palustris]
MSECPNFWSVFAEALQLSAAKRSIMAFVPWSLTICSLSPCLIIYFFADFLRPQITDSNATTMFSAIAVVAGFFGSVSVATIGQVQRMVAEYPFSSYLREEKLFDLFLFWPQFTLLVQIFLLLVSACAAIVVRLIDVDCVVKYFVAFDLGLLIYACTKTWKLVDLIRQLTWHYEDYNRLYREHKDGNGGC